MQDDTCGKQPLSRSANRVAIIGIGNAGLNTVTRLIHNGITNCETVVVSDDSFHLTIPRADHKFLLEERPDGEYELSLLLGEDSISSLEEGIRSALHGVETVLVVCGLGGSTGGRCTPRILSIARSMGIRTTAFCIWPFTKQIVHMTDIAEADLDTIKEYADRTVVFHNDDLLEVKPVLTLSAAFAIVDDLVVSNPDEIARATV